MEKDSEGNFIYLQGTKAKVITPSDTVTISRYGVNIYVGVSGDVACILAGMGDTDTPIIFKDLVAGVVHPIKVKMVMATDTTATDIVAVW